MSGKKDHVRVTTIERLDQGHLHPPWAPETDKFWPRIEPGPLWREATTLAKSYWNSCLIPIKTYTWDHDMALTAPGCRPNSTCKSFDQALASVHAQCQARQIMSGSPLLRDFTKVISMHPLLEHPKLTSPGGNRTRAFAVGIDNFSKELFEQLFIVFGTIHGLATVCYLSFFCNVRQYISLNLPFSGGKGRWSPTNSTKR